MENVTEIASEARGMFKPRFLGLGLVWSWSVASWGSLSIFGGEGYGLYSSQAWASATLTMAIALVAFALLLRGIRISCQLSFCSLGGGLASLGTLATGALAMLHFDVAALYALAGAITGIGGALLYLTWADCYSRFDTEKLEIIIPANGIVTIICVFLLPNMKGLSGWLLSAALPILSMVLLWRNNNQEQLEKQPKRDHLERKTLNRGTIQVLCCIMTLITVSGMLIAFPNGNIFLASQIEFDFLSYISTFVGACVAVAFSAASIFYSPRVDIVGLYRWLAPLLIIGALLFLQPTPPLPLFGDVCFKTADIMRCITIYIYFVGLGRKQVLDPVFGVGLAMGGCKLGDIAGNLVGAYGNTSEALTSTLFCCLMGAFMIAMALLPPRDKVNAILEGARSLPSGPSIEQKDNIAEACAIISERFELTPRESEVLDYLARGRSQPYIREALVLSRNTVASHVKRLYTKLDVHSKQELIDLVSSFFERSENAI